MHDWMIMSRGGGRKVNRLPLPLSVSFRFSTTRSASRLIYISTPLSPLLSCVWIRQAGSCTNDEIIEGDRLGWVYLHTLCAYARGNRRSFRDLRSLFSVIPAIFMSYFISWFLFIWIHTISCQITVRIFHEFCPVVQNFCPILFFYFFLSSFSLVLSSSFFVINLI